MRHALIVSLLVALPALATAQSRHERTADELPRPSIGLPLAQIGLPLPSMGLPLPPTGLTPRTSERSDRPERPERSDRFDHRGRGGAVFLYVPAFGWPYPYLPGTAVPSAPAPPEPPRRASGRLHFDLQSGVDPQIYVDGYYVGLVSDGNGELTLDAGNHAIELRQDGYENLHVDVQIPADGVVTYRGALTPIAAAAPRPAAIAAAPPASVPAPATIYMIPGCYVGNVAPKDAALPAGCDAARAIAFPSRP